MNPFTYITRSALPRGWKVVLISLLIAILSALPLLLLTAYSPEQEIPLVLGFISMFGVICGLISMIGGFLIILFDIYKQ
ncbi:MAG: hypothetical protein HWD86_09315 [Kangiellaceae bacterium]|nr:hypothetical protein [Kangiellaceae bacterium]